MGKLSTRHAAVTLGALLAGALVHCGGDVDNTDTDTNTDGGSSSGATTSSGGSSSSGGNCAPKTCADTAQCGTYDDGCGGTLRCESQCRCTSNDFDTTCPPRPCQVVAGCVDQVCQYAPVTCGTGGAERQCAPVACEGEGCGNVATTAGDEQKLYACGGSVCSGTAMYCDPTARVVEGTVTYQNRCVLPPSQGCGTCNLGSSACDTAADRFTCDAVPVPVLEGGGTVECNSTVVGSTFLFVDAEYNNPDADGSRERPYKTYTAAINAALARNARGIVIAGSPTFTEPLTLHNGISVYGGFGASPTFTPDRTQRPKWSIPASARQGSALRGALASNITSGTVLYHVAIETESVAAQESGHGVSNIGLWIEDSSALSVIEVNVTAGNGAHGADGTNGVAGAPGTPGGGGGNVRAPGGPGASCAAAFAACAEGGVACGTGGNVDRASSYYNASKPGLSGGPGGGSAGSAGRNFDAHESCPGSPGPNETPTPGGVGGGGANASAPAHAATVARIGFQGTSLTTPVRAVGAAGGNGARAGGGGGGGTFKKGCDDEAKWGGLGGGGGGPGCGGTGGQSGGSGGLSIAVAVLGSSTGVVFNGGEYRAGNGGNGGKGGDGGGGGEGGAGATGLQGVVDGSGIALYNGQKGGDGGKGGNGARGGHGAGGAAGASIALYCANPAANISGEGLSLRASYPGLRGPSSGNLGLGNIAQPTTCEALPVSVKRIYLTSVPNGDLGGIAGADALCQASAGKPADAVQVKAMLAGAVRAACTTAGCSGGANEHTDWVLQPLTRYERVDGTLIGVTNDIGLFSFPLSGSIDNDDREVFTGMSTDWRNAQNCSNWTSSSVTGAQGHANNTGSGLLRAYDQFCNRGATIYCVEQ